MPKGTHLENLNDTTPLFLCERLHSEVSDSVRCAYREPMGREVEADSYASGQVLCGGGGTGLV